MISEVTLSFALMASPPCTDLPCRLIALVTHTYEARIRLDGKVSTTRVQASYAGHAKKLVQSQFPTATVLSVKKVN